MEAQISRAVRDLSGSFNLATLDRWSPASRRSVGDRLRPPGSSSSGRCGRTTATRFPQRWLADLDAIPDGDTGEPESGYLVGIDTPTPQEAALLRKLTKEFGHGPTTADPEDAEQAPRASRGLTDAPRIQTTRKVARELRGTTR